VDLSRPDATEAILRSWIAERPDHAVRGFVHAAGLIYASPAVDVTADERRQTLAVNWEAAFVLARLAASRMEAGAMVFVSSVDVAHATPDGPAPVYAAAKAGLESLTRHLAVEWGPRGVRVNAVRLGPLKDGMAIQPTVQKRLQARSADHRLTSSEEAAEVVLWLLTRASRAIVGRVIEVDHGFGLPY
jgi:NAD(P)-dependent dehydrogenase (short-subunit alcohol dehydrogenase family)